ncbi:MAG: class I SAM-dependent methyltransferase [Candidatus Thermoplasmatota archaeon]|nr:class I SAM-dependent methyltransferase [Candidatus Thermoplasmatota archaeon]
MDERLAEVRARLLKLSEAAEAEGEPLRWFEELYASANRDAGEIPWARMEPHPKMVEWVASNPDVTGRALVVGCGLGDDAEWLSIAGFDVTAFDISQSSIDWCNERFPNSNVEYGVTDLLNPPTEWEQSFDLIVEIHILQAIPDPIRDEAAITLTRLLNDDGYLLCIGRLLTDRVPEEPAPPWPLSKVWLNGRFQGLEPHFFYSFINEDTPDITRYVASWKN